MNYIFEYILICLCSYLIGSFSISYFISRAKNIDMKKNGSGNLGASNAMILLGKKWGIITGIIDIFKAFIVVFLCKHFIFTDLSYGFIFAGISAVFGHIFPFYLKFKGGKGFASYLGAMLGIDFKFFICLMILVLLISFISNYIVLGTVTCTILSPMYIIVMFGIIPFLFALLLSSIIIIKHIPNFKRIKNGTEFKLRKVLFKK